MRYTAGTVYRPWTLKIDLAATRQCQVNLQVHDSKLPNTYFTRRFRIMAAGARETLYVQMPITGKAIDILIFAEGQLPDEKPTSFEVTGMKMLPLARQMDVLPDGKDVRHFVPFAERFCFNAAVLPVNHGNLYVSDRGGFQIKYVETITEEGGEQLTPARIGIYDKIIEISKSKWVPMTVPMRLCILFHEFSHLFVNEEMTDEVEADLNGLHIYLALGYPRIEAHETFLDVFKSAQTQENFERYERITSFIDKFEQLNAM